MLQHVCFLRILGKEDVAEYEAVVDKAFDKGLSVDDLPVTLANSLKAAADRKGLKLSGDHPVISQLKYTGRHRFDLAGRPIPGTESSDGPETWVFRFRVELDDAIQQAAPFPS